jgi:hypothetical protein
LCRSRFAGGAAGNTNNNPIGDIAEAIVATHGGERGSFSQAGWDARLFHW